NTEVHILIFILELVILGYGDLELAIVGELLLTLLRSGHRSYQSQVRLTEYGGPERGWNDPDMLVLGFERIPYDEQVTHYAFWAALKAPLILGCD
ncbi:2128_t:CDS:2, partial [Gigaspora rosea]